MQTSDFIPGPGHSLYLPEDAGAFTRLRISVRAIHALGEDQTDGIAGPVLNMAMDAETYERLAVKLAQTEEGRALLSERPNLQAGAIDIAALRALPEGTLGHALAGYYADNGISPFRSTWPVRNEVEYLAKRYREVHDIAHVVTGYGTSMVGEMELQAFVLGNMGFRQSALIMTFTAILCPMGIPPVWKYAHKLRSAYRRGRHSKDVVISPRYERYWESTVEQVRARVGLAPA